MKFENIFVESLPADPQTENFPRQVSNACYSFVDPTPVKNPSLVAVSPDVAELLNFSEETIQSTEFLQMVSGNKLPESIKSYAMCYGGHQFGQWAGQLGDGRAINCGEIVNKNNQRWSLQLKGAGLTPYSRSADGLAVMRSSVREFLCSEAMHFLGVPTTRALSLVNTGEHVVRDMFYDGRPEKEPGAVVCRVAPSFIRFGNFEILAARNDVALLKKLIDFTITTYFPHLIVDEKISLDSESAEKNTAVYLAWFSEIANSTAKMIIDWMRVGFVHGVMNTDNMSIHGLTIDYGPYGWLDNYDPQWTPNTTDAQQRRYRFENQPGIAQWNLLQLANAIYPVVQDSAGLEEIIQQFATDYMQGYNLMMCEKLGLMTYAQDSSVLSADQMAKENKQLLDDLLTLLPASDIDMTIFFRSLANLPLSESRNKDQSEQLLQTIENSFYLSASERETQTTALLYWLKTYQARITQRMSDDATTKSSLQTLRKQRMDAVNPKFIFRNYLAQLAIDKAEEGDNSLVNEWLDVMRRPYDEQPDKEKFAQKRPDWAKSRPGCSMLSCSS